MGRADLSDLDNVETVRELAEAAGLIVWDGAVPQDWFDNHQKEIAERGPVVWSYDAHVVGPQHKLMGAPVFADTLAALTRCRRAAEAARYELMSERDTLAGDLAKARDDD